MNSKTTVIARGVGIIAATLAVVVGVTLAALQSNSVTLSGNTISTATLSLQIWNGSAFAGTAPGIQFSNIPLDAWSTPQFFYLQNNGSGNLALTSDVPAAPALSNIASADSVNFLFTDTSTGHTSQCTLTQLEANNCAIPDTLAAGAQGDSGNPTAPGNYTVQIYIPSSAVSGSSAGVASFDLQLTGTQSS